jgi:hypothetical protein
MVKLTIPFNLELMEAKRFVDNQILWLDDKLKNIGPFHPLVDGMMLPIGGKERKLSTEKDIILDFYLDADTIKFPKNNKPIELQVKNFFKTRAKSFFSESCKIYSEKLDTSYQVLNIKDPKTRWGSCSSDGNLMFSWRLMMAPHQVSDYVAAHEVAHLIHLNHSTEFWNTVKKICPNYEEHRKWLRKNGKGLHNFVF